MKNPGGGEFFFGAETDSRKPVVFELSGFTYQSRRGDDANVELEVEWKPADNVALSVSPGVNWNRSTAQYVGTFDDVTATATFGRRYVFGALDQRTFSSSVRLNWTFTPMMSLQLFAQPLISSGSYTGFKELAAPKTFDFLEYGVDGSSTIQLEEGGAITADPDGVGGAAAPLEFSDPSFNFKSLRGTAVLRWEFRPGSTLFLVWTQSRSHFEEDGRFRFGRSFDRLLETKPDNIFVVKLTYWLSR